MSNKADLGKLSFSQPHGPARLYGRPPYSYRDARTITVAYIGNANGIAPFLPPGVEVADPEPLVAASVSHYGKTPFGSYHEIWFYVRATFRGERFVYAALMYADGELAIAAGRELWGFPKKRADMSLTLDGEQWNFKAHRSGQRLLDLSFVADNSDTAVLADTFNHPTLTLRLIPNFTGEGDPDIAQLIRFSNEKRLRVNALGTLEREGGRAAVTLGQDTAADPLSGFNPKRVLGAWMSEYDCEVPAGQLVHDYKTAD